MEPNQKPTKNLNLVCYNQNTHFNCFPGKLMGTPCRVKNLRPEIHTKFLYLSVFLYCASQSKWKMMRFVHSSEATSLAGKWKSKL